MQYNTSEILMCQRRIKENTHSAIQVAIAQDELAKSPFNRECIGKCSGGIDSELDGSKI